MKRLLEKEEKLLGKGEELLKEEEELLEEEGQLLERHPILILLILKMYDHYYDYHYLEFFIGENEENFSGAGGNTRGRGRATRGRGRADIFSIAENGISFQCIMIMLDIMSRKK